MREKLFGVLSNPAVQGLAALATVATAVAGAWVYFTEPELCERAVFEETTDASLCGTSERVVEVAPATFKTCSRRAFGRVAWEHSERQTHTCGWQGGGSDPTECCNTVLAEFIANNGIGSDRETVEHGKWEKRREKPVRRFEYKYWCDFEVRWGSVYAARADPLCGENPPVTRTEQVPNTCRRQVGTERVECSLLREAPNPS